MERQLEERGELRRNLPGQLELIHEAAHHKVEEEYKDKDNFEGRALCCDVMLDTLYSPYFQ